jgi:predicted homoserine dehydrogenase-like protein
VAEQLLPIGLATGATLVRAVDLDTPITTTDVEIKPSTVFSLRQLQDRWSQGAIADAELLAAVDQLATD